MIYIFKRLKLYFKFTRPFTLLPPALGMISGSFVALRDYNNIHIFFPYILLGGIATSILNGASNSLNQIFDINIDRINKSYRPLVKGDISIKEAWSITIILYILAFVLAYNININYFIILLIIAFFTFIYSVPPFRTKRHWLLASLTIAIPRGILLKVAGWSIIKDIFYFEPWFIGIIFGLFLFGATTTKDYADIKGDKIYKCETLPIKFGIKKSIYIIAPFFIFPFFLFPIGSYLNILHGNKIILFFLGIVLSAWGYYVVLLLLRDYKNITSLENHISWVNMYLMMMFAQISLIIAYIF